MCALIKLIGLLLSIARIVNTQRPVLLGFETTFGVSLLFQKEEQRTRVEEEKGQNQKEKETIGYD